MIRAQQGNSVGVLVGLHEVTVLIPAVGAGPTTPTVARDLDKPEKPSDRRRPDAVSGAVAIVGLQRWLDPRNTAPLAGLEIMFCGGEDLRHGSSCGGYVEVVNCVCVGFQVLIAGRGVALMKKIPLSRPPKNEPNPQPRGRPPLDRTAFLYRCSPGTGWKFSSARLWGWPQLACLASRRAPPHR